MVQDLNVTYPDSVTRIRDLYVVLSQRAAGMRSHGGDTAIPGGRFELGDADLEATAVRPKRT